jgi:hypothetical protein
MLFRKITEDIQKWMDPTVQRQQFVSLDKVVFPQLDKNDLPAMTYDKELPLGGFSILRSGYFVSIKDFHLDS